MVKARTLQNVQPGPTGTMTGLAWTRLQIVLVPKHMGLVELLILFNSTLLARGRVSVAENPPEGNVQPDLRLCCPYVSPWHKAAAHSHSHQICDVMRSAGGAPKSNKNKRKC